MPSERDASTPAFLAGGGEMGALMRAHDWSTSLVGLPSTWSQALRVAVRILLNTHNPMYIFWGQEGACFYNDAYRQSIGSERHPGSLGRPIRDVWAEIYGIIGPQFEQVIEGRGATWHEDQLVPITRNGVVEDVYWTYGYSPIDDEEAPGGIGGVLVVCNETTARVLAECKLVGERERFAQLFEQAPTFMAMLRGPDHRIELANPGYARLVGHREVLGRTVAEALPEAVAQGFLELLDGVYRTGVAYAANGARYAVQAKPDGPAVERFVDFVYQPILDGEGQVSGIFVEGVDVTARAAADAARRDSEAELGHLFEGMGEGFILYDADLRISRINEAAMRMDGRDRGAFIGRHILEVWPEAEQFPSYAAYRQVVSDRRQRTFTYRHVSDTHDIWIEVNAYPAGDGVASFYRDVTDAKREKTRRDALVALADRLRDLQSSTDIAYAAAEILAQTFGVGRAGYGMVDPIAETVYIPRDWTAPGLQSLAGVRRFRDYGDYIDDLQRGEMVAISDVRTDPRTANRAEALSAIDARAILNLPVLDDQRFVGLLYINAAEPRVWSADDISLTREIADRTLSAIQRRRAEEELQDFATSLERQVEKRTSDLMKAEEALRQSQKMEAVGQLTGGVAHDFNNLLTVIKSSTDLLKRPDLKEERRLRYVAAISDTVDRAAKLTGQLLAFARRQSLRPEVFDVGQSVHQLADMMNTLTGSRIRIVTRMPDAPCFINADPSQFDTAVINMAVNARDAMDGQGQLTVEVREFDEMPAIRAHAAVKAPFVAVSLTDTGGGIPAGVLERIFEPFFTTKGVGKGTGLGLSQVYGFAKQSGGEVMVESRVGEGSTFTLYLPEVIAPTEVVAESEPEPLVDGHGTSVLVVEDNHDVGTFATQTLAELGYVTVWAPDAEQALQRLAESADGFDIVFSDVVMPGMGGIELGQEIRRRYPTLPVVLTSGYSHVLAQNGTYGFELLHKPYSVEQLSRVLRNAASWQRRRRLLGR